MKLFAFFISTLSLVALGQEAAYDVEEQRYRSLEQRYDADGGTYGPYRSLEQRYDVNGGMYGPYRSLEQRYDVDGGMYGPGSLETRDLHGGHKKNRGYFYGAGKKTPVIAKAPIVTKKAPVVYSKKPAPVVSSKKGEYY